MFFHVFIDEMNNMRDEFISMPKNASELAPITLAGNVGICVCRLHPPNDRHLCLSTTCRDMSADRSATFC